MQTNLCTKNLWLHDLPHDLYSGVNDHITNGKLGRAKNQMDDCTGQRMNPLPKNGRASMMAMMTLSSSAKGERSTIRPMNVMAKV